MLEKDWWSEAFRWTITFLVFAVYSALVFYRVDGNFQFLRTFEYWFDTISTTILAFYLRYLWSFKGLNMQLRNNSEIKQQEKGKEKLIIEVTSKNLSDELEKEIDIHNANEKKRKYRDLCQFKIRQFSGKGFKFFKKYRLEKWKNELEYVNSDDFNPEVVKVKYYKYDINSMLTSTFKTSHSVETRGNMNSEVFKSYRLNFLTLIGLGILNGLELFQKDFSSEDALILLGKFIIFTLNIYTGLSVGKTFVDDRYSNDISRDYVFLNGFLKKFKEV